MSKQTQRFRVAPNAPITGGTAAYTADLDSGQIAYQASVQVKVVFFPVTKNFSGNYALDPQAMLSSNLSKVGQSETIAGLTLKVIAINGTQAQVSVTQASLNGGAVLDISDTYVKLISMDAEAIVSDRTIQINLVEQEHLF